jgi:hypothetical protein
LKTPSTHPVLFAQGNNALNNIEKENKMSVSKKPTHHVYHVKNYESKGEEKAVWTKIGAAWAHEDGEGFTQQLDMVPLDGLIVTRKVQEKDALSETSV